MLVVPFPIEGRPHHEVGRAAELLQRGGRVGVPLVVRPKRPGPALPGGPLPLGQLGGPLGAGAAAEVVLDDPAGLPADPVVVALLPPGLPGHRCATPSARRRPCLRPYSTRDARAAVNTAAGGPRAADRPDLASTRGQSCGYLSRTARAIGARQAPATSSSVPRGVSGSTLPWRGRGGRAGVPRTWVSTRGSAARKAAAADPWAGWLR
jgi:hypothetical protein